KVSFWNSAWAFSLCKRSRCSCHKKRRTTSRISVKKIRTGHMASFRLDKAVADSAHRIKVFGGVAELFAQAAHVGVHRAGVDHSVIFPDVAEKLLARLHAAPALGEDGEELKFGGGEIHAAVVHLGDMAGDVHAEFTDLHKVRILRRLLLALEEALDAED